MIRELAIVLLVSVALATACGDSQQSQPLAPTPAPVSPAQAPAKQEQPTVGFGVHSHAIQTSNPEAQRAFDQGMALGFGFNHEAAIRSFQRASELDPNAAMPHWGRAWALGPNYNLDIDDPRAKQAFEAIDQARKLAAQGPEPERAYVEALAARYSSDIKTDRATLARAYSKAMGELSKKYPADLDAATLYAESLMNLTPWKLWTLDGKPAEDTEQILAVLESVLKRNPNHLGANHFYIHAVEASRNPGRALPSAKRLDTLAPASGHLVHMPAHIYARTGDHAAAARSNTAGAAADLKYLATAPADSLYGLMYYSHNLHFLADSHMMQGRFGDAQQAAARVAERLDRHTAMMPMIESMIVVPVSVQLRFSRHANILALTAPAASRPVQTAWHRFARGVALAGTGKVDEAAAERAALAQAAAKVPESALFGGGGFENARTVLDLATSVLDARIAWARNEREKAIQLWQRAVAAADKLPYDEPPVWFYPVRESLGAALLLSDRAADAERVFGEDLERNPRNPRSLFGLQASLAKQGKADEAARVQKEFDEAWKNADTMLTVEGL